MGKPASTGQIHYQFQDDGADANTSTLLGSEDTQNDNLLLDTTYFLRIKIDNTGDDPEASQVYQLQCDIDSGGYNNVTTSSSNVRAVDGSDTDGDTMGTERLTTSGTYDSTNSQYIEDGASTAFALAAGNSAELVFAIQFRSADLPGGETVSFRLLGGGATIDRYDVTPVAGMAQVELPGAGSVVLTGIVPTIEVNKDLIAGNPDALVLTGAAPSIGVSASPGGDALVLTGQTPARGVGLRLTGQQPTPDVAAGGGDIQIEVPVGSLTIASAAPTLLTNYIRPPAVVGLVITPQTPDPLVNHIRGPPVVALDLTGVAPSIGTSVSPTTVGLSINSDAGSAEETHNVVGGNPDALQIGSDAPTALVGFNIQGVVGSLVISGQTPSAEEVHNVVAGAPDALVLSGQQPSLGTSASPGADALVLSGQAPSIGTSASPGGDALVLAGVAPTIDVASTGTSIEVPATQLNLYTGYGLRLTGQAPTIIKTEDLASDNLVISSDAPSVLLRTPGVASLTISSDAPSVGQPGETVTPSVGTLTLATDFPGGQPDSLVISSDVVTVLEEGEVAPSVRNLTLTGGQPVVTVDNPARIELPQTGTLTISSDAPTLIYNPVMGVGSLSISSDAPIANVGFNQDPGVGSLTISSDAPTLANVTVVPAGSLIINERPLIIDVTTPGRTKQPDGGAGRHGRRLAMTARQHRGYDDDDAVLTFVREFLRRRNWDD